MDGFESFSSAEEMRVKVTVLRQFTMVPKTSNVKAFGGVFRRS